MFNPFIRFLMPLISVFTPGNWEIYCAVTPDTGATWTIKRLTNNAGQG